MPDCIPFIEGCTSISRTGRYGTSYFIFKALMMPAAVVIMLYWIMTYAWLKALDCPHPKSLKTLLTLGVVAGLFLILYTTFLGSEGEIYRLMRRFGTTTFFLFSYLGHLLLAFLCFRVFGFNRITRWKITLCAAVSIQLLIFVLAKNFVDQHDWIENAIEWQSAYLLTLLPVLTWLLWNRTGFGIDVTVKRS